MNEGAMIETAAADSTAKAGDAVTTPSDSAARDLHPVTVSDTMFDDAGYTPLDIYGGGGGGSGAAMDDPSVSVVASCPHAGRSYPASMLAMAQEPVGALRGLEDFGVDCLLPRLADAGITTVINRFSRAYIDVNRDPAAIDASMFSSPVSTRPPCHHVRAGYGLIPRLTAARKQIYAGKLPATEIDARLARVHTPYHAALASMMDSTVNRFGKALLIDMHSMPAFDRLNNRMSDMIFGDAFGTTLDRDTAAAITSFFQKRGLSITWNHPYAGGFITRQYGTADSPRQSVQVEINRDLYMDGPARLNPSRVAELRDMIGEFGKFLVAHLRTSA